MPKRDKNSNRSFYMASSTLQMAKAGNLIRHFILGYTASGAARVEGVSIKTAKNYYLMLLIRLGETKVFDLVLSFHEATDSILLEPCEKWAYEELRRHHGFENQHMRDMYYVKYQWVFIMIRCYKNTIMSDIFSGKDSPTTASTVVELIKRDIDQVIRRTGPLNRTPNTDQIDRAHTEFFVNINRKLFGNRRL